MSDRSYDVAIVGYGPAGATLANLLGRAGLRVLVLERQPDIYPLPRAIHFDGEVMRVFESVGLRDRIEAITRVGLHGMHFVNDAGKTLLVRHGNAALGPHGCATSYYFHQPDLELVLRDGVQRFANVDVRLRSEVVAMREIDESVELDAIDSATGELHSSRARFVVGCDGARSFLRKTMGSPMEDLGLQQPWLVFDVRLRANAPALPDYTVQYCDPKGPMTYCNVTGNRRRWEIMVMPGDDPETLVAPENVWRRLRRWIGPEHAELERAVIYTFRSTIARGWRKGRLLLAGDAAHQTPPFLGQGMCAAIRDVSNLAWKLAAVASGRAPESLFDTYESERRPHVRAFIELAVRLGDIIQTTDPERARQRDARFRQGQPEVFEFPSPRLGSGVWQGDADPIARPFPQPRLEDGRLLDERTGDRFVVIAVPEIIDGVSASTRDRWRDSAVEIVADGGSALRAWLRAHAAGAVVVRPDRYVLGLARTSKELEHLATLLPEATEHAARV